MFHIEPTKRQFIYYRACHTPRSGEAVATSVTRVTHVSNGGWRLCNEFNYNKCSCHRLQRGLPGFA